MARLAQNELLASTFSARKQDAQDSIQGRAGLRPALLLFEEATLKSARTFATALALALVLAAGLDGSTRQATSDSPTAHEVTALLQQFLRDVPGNSPATYDNFFADDILYTRSTGAFVTKADIMRGIRGPSSAAPSANAAPPSAAAGTTTTYSAEDIVIHEYGDTAIIAFRLVSHIERAGGSPATVANYRNTGVFLRRNGRWQAVASETTKAGT